MKSHRLALLSAALVAALPVTLSAQVTTTETKTTTTTGSVTTFAPDILTVRTESSATPLRYSYTKTTKFVDTAGAPVSMEIIKSGAPVVVHYVKEGDQMIAQRVVVQKTTTATPGAVTETKKTTTTTSEPGATTEIKTVTTSGTVSALDTQAIALRTETSTSPVRYTFTKKTTYVDEAGNPVSINVVKSGAPVTVHYITEGDQQIAQKVVVKKTTTTVR